MHRIDPQPAPVAARPGEDPSELARLRRDFAGVDTWIFDLDNTLYPAEARLFSQIEMRMTAYVQRLLGVDEAEANRLRAHYWREHGTTLAGLMAHHDIEPRAYLGEVHDIDFSVLAPDPQLALAISALPGRKIVHTNADATYAGKVLAQCEITVFEAVYGIEEVGFNCKPDPRSFAAVAAAHGIEPGRAAMFEDDPRNLECPHSLGMRTVLVGPGHRGPDPAAKPQEPGGHVHYATRDLTAFLRRLARALGDMAD